MTFRLKQRPDLRLFFGPLSTDEHERLLDRMLAVDARFKQLALDATRHVGVPYEVFDLTFSPGVGLDGGPSGKAGDIWFDVSGSAGRPPWVVESRLVVLCSDGPEPDGDSNCHDLVRSEATVETPGQVIDALEAHVAALSSAIIRFSPEAITATPHDQLP